MTSQSPTLTRPEQIFTSPDPAVGLVIGTYSSVPYIHLQLETWRRLYEHVPVLVHDDASPDEEALRSLCTRYGADFSRNNEPHGHFAGDMTVFTAGMQWGRHRHLDLLVKFSRRFIPRVSWITELQNLAYVTQYATFSNVAEDVRFGFRTECMAMHLGSWLVCHLLEYMEKAAREAQGQHIFNEREMHLYAKEVYQNRCVFNQRYEIVHPPIPGREAYGAWPLMGTSRSQRLPHVLWHDACPSFEYYLAARSYGLTDYIPQDFESPAAAPETDHG